MSGPKHSEPNLRVCCVDVGSSAIKVDMADREGRMVESWRSEFRLGWTVEALSDAIGAALDVAQAGSAHKVICTSLLGFVIMDPAGRALDLFLWNDGRGGEDAADLCRRFPDLPALCGRPVDRNLGIVKALWYERHHPTDRDLTLLSIKDWMNFRLTGQLATDPVFASYMGVWNVAEGSPLHEVAQCLKACGLPPVQPIGATIGTISGAGLRAKVINGTVDGATGLAGCSPVKTGAAVLIAGSTDVLFGVTDRYTTVSGCITNPMGALYLVGGGMSATGLFASWLRRWGAVDLGHVEPKPTAVVCLPYLGGSRTPWHDDVLGGFYGITHDAPVDELYLALLEASAFEIRHMLMVLSDAGIPTEGPLRVAGGAISPTRAAILARVTGRPVSFHGKRATNRGALAIATGQMLRAETDPAVEYVDPGVQSGYVEYLDEKYRSYLSLRRHLAELSKTP